MIYHIGLSDETQEVSCLLASERWQRCVETGSLGRQFDEQQVQHSPM